MAAAEEASAINAQLSPEVDRLAGYIRGRFDTFRRHRSSASGWNDRLLAAMRAFNGEYPPDKLHEIRKFGGSDVYARLIAVKCRGATSLLRDIYLGPERPWGIDPTPDPTIPQDIAANVMQLVQAEASRLQMAGMPVTDAQVTARAAQLMAAAKRATVKQAREAAAQAEDRVDDLLVEGGFYTALQQFLVDLPLFPFAVIKGPTVRIVPDVKWVPNPMDPQGPRIADVVDTPKLQWERVSPFDLWWTPGVNRIEDAEVIERRRLTRADLNACLGLPGYDEEAIRTVLREYGEGGLHDWLDDLDAARAALESREDPNTNSSGIIDTLEFHGNVQGRMLREYGYDEASGIEDDDRDYAVQAWLVGRHVIKVQLAPSPRKRHPFFITSFEKVPGTVLGNALPDILEDVADVANAALRSLVNNMGMCSGPQVVINDDRLAPDEDADELYPWKRWHTVTDSLGNQRAPIEFFMPSNNAGALLQAYKEMTQIADDISAIPRYATGTDRVGGAGRTASGLSMLMNNSSKILQTVADNIDRDVMEGLLQSLYDMLMLTGVIGELRGDEAIRVRGVTVAAKRESERQRVLEMLQITGNPIDMGIIGPLGRAKLLKAVSDTVGLDGEDIVPSPDELQQRLQQEAMAAQAGSAPAADEGGFGAGAPQAAGKPKATQGPRQNDFQPRPAA